MLGIAERLAPLNGAGNEGRTRDLKLGKLALCQLSYTRVNPLYPSRTLAIKHNIRNLSRTSTTLARPAQPIAIHPCTPCFHIKKRFPLIKVTEASPS